ncbi:MAG TPA: type II toxin-antitoxin system death-on-curing family toxin [Acidobacteriota bacterium]|jgi:death-on-curing protein|nr:type II toxin-antitoxin system death-on-curing family toxin [Acidobacteriota bacterium]
MAERFYLTVGEVLQIHLRLINDYGGTQGIRDKGLLESAVFRPQIGYYNSIAEEAAALMESLANNHPFLDGNKRVAFAVAHTFLLVNGCDLELQPLAAHEFMIQSIARGEFRFGQILEWITKHIRCE